MIDKSEINRNFRVIGEIQGAYFIWAASGNQFIRLDEPAYFVLNCLEKGMDRTIIAEHCAQRYQNTKEDSLNFVSEIGDNFDHLSTITGKAASQLEFPVEIYSESFTPYSSRNYLIRGKRICFRFETALHEFYVHPILKHLECSPGSDNAVTFELFNYNERFVLRIEERISGWWGQDESHLLMGKVSLEILNVIYCKGEEDWMAVIHASAITDGKSTVIFTASPGSGKSTIAALLVQKGFSLVSDDLVPIERESKMVYPFPAAISVKEGSQDLLSLYYPTLKIQSEPEITRTNKLVRYIPIESEAIPAPAKAVIFIKYDPTIDFAMEKLPFTESLKLLLDETWTYPSFENAKEFIYWHDSVNCYRITYSDNDKAVSVITKLFNND